MTQATFRQLHLIVLNTKVVLKLSLVSLFINLLFLNNYSLICVFFSDKQPTASKTKENNLKIRKSKASTSDKKGAGKCSYNGFDLMADNVYFIVYFLLFRH